MDEKIIFLILRQERDAFSLLFNFKKVVNRSALVAVLVMLLLLLHCLPILRTPTNTEEKSVIIIIIILFTIVILIIFLWITEKSCKRVASKEKT